MDSQPSSSTFVLGFSNSLVKNALSMLPEYEANSSKEQLSLVPLNFAQKKLEISKKKLYRAGWRYIESPEDDFPEIKKSENINGKRNFNHLNNDSNSESFEYVGKKVKLTEDLQRNISEVSTICTSPVQLNDLKIEDSSQISENTNQLLPVLYCYERHLRFTKSPDFNSKLLKKI